MEAHECRTCGGRGWDGGAASCAHCKGTGVAREPCKACKGEGVSIVTFDGELVGERVPGCPECIYVVAGPDMRNRVKIERVDGKG